jgi:hypothetical protein
MNEKINKLWDKAVNLIQDNNDGDWSLDACKDKFAELIVRECADITDDLVDRNTDGTWTSNELYTDYNGALFEVKRRIKEHFGVEL